MTRNGDKRRTGKAGFTLVEMLVVVGITTLLMGYVLTYSSSSRNQIYLYTEEVKIAQTIARAKSLAIATYNQSGVPCGYGVRFEYGVNGGTRDRYSLFRYDPPSCASFDIIEPVFSTILGDGVEMVPEYLSISRDHNDALEYIFFVPPDPDTYIWRVGSFVSSTDATVYVRTKDGSASLRVRVNSAGQISF